MLARKRRNVGKYMGKQQWVEYLKQPFLRQPFVSFFPLKLRLKRQSFKIVVWRVEGSYLSKEYYTNDFESCPKIVL